MIMPSVTKTSKPAVSVVMPSYNAADTIVQTIRSIGSQDLTDWELIVVDDGSSDETVQRVAELATTDSRLRVVCQANAGPSTARNRGVAEARAEIVAFLDSDDIWEPRHLSNNFAALEADVELGVSFSPCRIIDAAGRSTGEQTAKWTRQIAAADVLSCNPACTCSSLVVRKAVFTDVGGFRTDMAHAEDQEWLLRVVGSRWQTRGLAEATVRYRVSPSGLSADIAKMHRGWESLVEEARLLDPAGVDASIPDARANMHLYFARRLLRAGQANRSIWTHAWTAMRSSPRVVLAQPKTALMVIASLIMPQRMITQLLELRRPHYV